MAAIVSPVGDANRNSAGSHRDATTPGSSRSVIRSAGVGRWKKMHEENAMIQLSQMRLEKKTEAKISHENAQKIARKIPVEVLAKEWLSNLQATVDIRVYLVDKVLPTLILGLEKLLNEAETRKLVNAEAGGGFDPDFNPINFLAQYLMRNNPRYSNFTEASPYVRGLRQVAEELRAQLFDLHDNRLARIKAEAKRKRAEREELAHIRQMEKERRQEILSTQFEEWNIPSDSNKVELSLLQNALRSFVEVVEQFPPELHEAAKFGHPLEPTDESGHMLTLKEFVKYLSMYVESLSSEIFDQFMVHMAECSKAYCASAEREDRRIALTNLFIYCDHSGIGLLDRHRILSLFEQFWDIFEDSRGTMRNPRTWPVVEVDEVDDSLNEDEEAQRDKLSVSASESGMLSTESQKPDGDDDDDEKVKEKDKEDDDARTTAVKDSSGTEKSEKTATESNTSLTVQTGKMGEKAEDTSAAEDADNEKTEESLDKVAQGAVSTSVMERASVTFAQDTTFEREITGLSIARSQSQTSAFDEDNLNVSQFVQLTETFLGEYPDKGVFEKLVAFLREGYEETEDEKIKRLLRARKEALSANRKLMLNALFEKWDNDGSGYLDLDEVGDVMAKYKDSQEEEAIAKARVELKNQSKYHDARLSKQEFCTFVDLVVGNIPGRDTFEYFVEFLTNSVERSYAEKVRGEARKKWLQQIMTTAETSGINLESVYKSVFQALYRDAETHGGEKRISANIALLERNTAEPERGDVMLRYTACTPEDSVYVLNQILYKDMKGISFAVVENGQPVHVPRVNTHGNIHFWNVNRSPEEREGSFIVVPLKDRKKRVFGVLGIDTLSDPHSKAIFITHEVQFFQGIAQTFSTAYHIIELRRKLLRITESAISWIKRRALNVAEIMVYLVEPSKAQDFVLRRIMTTDDKGFPIQLKDPAIRLERKDNLFRDYLFKCVDNSETVTADAYGQRHLAFPLRNDEGKAKAVVDLSLGAMRKLPAHENRETQRMLRLLQQAYKEITREFEGEERLQVLDAEKDDETRMEIMFDRLMLMELRENVSKLDNKAYAELKAYYSPPEIVLHILRATLAIFYQDLAEHGEFDDWNTIKSYIDSDLSQNIQQYDPTSAEELISPSIIENYLKEVPHGEVAKHGSLPAQYLYNWVFVCLSLIEHTKKMRQNSDEGAIATSDLALPAAKEDEEEDANEDQDQEENINPEDDL